MDRNMMIALLSHFSEEEKYEASLPICDICGEHTEKYWEIDGEQLCEECLSEYENKHLIVNDSKLHRHLKCSICNDLIDDDYFVIEGDPMHFDCIVDWKINNEKEKIS